MRFAGNDAMMPGTRLAQPGADLPLRAGLPTQRLFRTSWTPTGFTDGTDRRITAKLPMQQLGEFPPKLERILKTDAHDSVSAKLFNDTVGKAPRLNTPI